MWLEALASRRPLVSQPGSSKSVSRLSGNQSLCPVPSAQARAHVVQIRPPSRPLHALFQFHRTQSSQGQVLDTWWSIDKPFLISRLPHKGTVSVVFIPL